MTVINEFRLPKSRDSGIFFILMNIPAMLIIFPYRNSVPI